MKEDRVFSDGPSRWPPTPTGTLWRVGAARSRTGWTDCWD